MTARFRRTNRSHPLRLACWNANGVHSKKLELEQFLSEQGVDILLLNETHLTAGQSFRLANYVCHRNDRPTQGGGTAILVRRGLDHHAFPVSGLQHLEATAIHLFLAVITYASPAWAPYINKRHLRKLQGAQRTPLLRITSAYRTTPTSALQVLARALPIGLELERRTTNYLVKRGRPITVGNTFIGPDDEATLAAASDILKTHLHSQWQEQWVSDATGRKTFDFFPSIADRLSSKWVKINKSTTPLLTGHGYTNSYLHRFGLLDTPMCTCDAAELEDVEHILYSCRKYTHPREQLRLQTRLDREPWPPPFSYWMGKAQNPAFSTFAEAVNTIRNLPVAPP